MREKGRPAGQNNVGQVRIEADRQTDTDTKTRRLIGREKKRKKDKETNRYRDK